MKRGRPQPAPDLLDLARMQIKFGDGDLPVLALLFTTMKRCLVRIADRPEKDAMLAGMIGELMDIHRHCLRMKSKEKPMPYIKPKTEAYLARKAMLDRRRERQNANESAFNSRQVAAFAAYWKSVRAKNGVGRPSFEKRAALKLGKLA